MFVYRTIPQIDYVSEFYIHGFPKENFSDLNELGYKVHIPKERKKLPVYNLNIKPDGRTGNCNKRLVFAPAKFVDTHNLLELRIDYCQLSYEIYKLKH